MARRQALRRMWWQLHQWIGLSLMILLIPLGLSGVVLAWDDAIDHALNPQRYAVHGAATLAPAAYTLAAKRELWPGERIATIRYPDGEGPVTVNAVADGERALPARPRRVMLWLDPATGRVLDVARGDGGLVRLAHDFHGSLFVPGFGRALIGLLGVAMFLMAAGGVWLWWPPVGSWIGGLRWRRGDRRLETNLHHSVGFWIALPLAFQAFTGVWIAWPQMMAAIGVAPARGGGERARMVPVAAPALTPDRALAPARGLRPGAPTAIAWPVGADGAWRISVRIRGGQADMLVEDKTGRATPAPPRAGGLAMTSRRLHDGTTWGAGWRALMILLGLAPTVLGVTGLVMWLRGRRWRARIARAKASRVAVAADAG